MNNILSVKNLNKHYGDNHVLKDVSISINENEIISILGRNGAGKTTLIESIFNLNNKSSGEIKFFDFPTNLYNDLVKEKIGVQLQISELFPNQTVHEILETFNIIKRNKTDIPNIIKQFSLKNILSKKNKNSFSWTETKINGLYSIYRIPKSNNSRRTNFRYRSSNTQKNMG